MKTNAMDQWVERSLKQIQASDYLTGLSKDNIQTSVLETDSESAQTLAQAFEKKLEQVCQSVEQADVQALGEGDSAAEFLKHSKAEFSFNWCIAEVGQSLPLDKLGQWQTRFAEVTIELALQVAWQQVANKNKAIIKTLQQHEGQMPGLFILGMGKLGGKDLNFSSDIDLVAYFDPAQLPVPDTLGKSYICHQVLQALTKLLNQHGHSDFIWRVDWRLRPNASATTLAMSVAAAEDYYFFHASPWHRLALMKARVIAGDKQNGQLFLNIITPFIWRQNLDYRALDELAEIKQRINLEHPSLKAQRQWREPISDDIAGFNVKLGTGGIREVEFIANALQLIWGGKQYALRTPNTRQVLRALAELGHLPTDHSEQLIAAYDYLRHLENCIQIMENQQTHLIPSEAVSQQNLLLLHGAPTWADLLEKLNLHRQIVSTYFEEAFSASHTEEDDQLDWPEDLSTSAQEIVDAWIDGFLIYGAPNSMRDKLMPLVQHLSRSLSEQNTQENTNQNASEVVMRIHDFFRSIPQGGQYFRLLAESPSLVQSIIAPLLHSPAMTNLLKQSPHIVDCYMQSSWKYDDTAGRQPFDSDYIFQADNYEIRLERLRRFVNEYLYQLYLQFMQGEIGVEVFQKALSHLATHTLECSLRLVQEKLDLSSVPITIIGLGKLAMQRMSPMSDLDLIFIYDQDQTPMELASKFVMRLQTAISTPMREGIVYELDTRLRPSGRSGAPTVSVQSFAKHHLERAHTWEHIALVPSKVVAGDFSLSSPIEQVKQQVLATPREPDQLHRDIIKMWDRVAQHRIKQVASDQMFSKLRVGGLMQAEYYAASLVLANSNQFLQGSSTNQSMEFHTLLEQAQTNAKLDIDLPEIIQFWRIQQLWERLLDKEQQKTDSLAKPYLDLLLQQSSVDNPQQLAEKKQDYAQQVINAMEKTLADYPMTQSQISDWHEQSVQWT